MNTLERVRAIREGGYVKRYHTMPLVGGDYTVGKHSYDVLSLLLLLYPEPGPSLNLIRAALWHDTGERWWGDMPAPAKWESPHLAAIYERAEARTLELLGIQYTLTDEELLWLKAVDRIELWMFCLEQLYMGNRNLERSCAMVVNTLEKMAIGGLPSEVYEFYRAWAPGRGDERPPTKEI